MTFLEALYGSQYAEVQQAGKDGAKGRFNGNIFLSVFLIMIVIVLILIFSHVPSFKYFLRPSGFMAYFGGRFMGKILALPVFALFYFILSKTIGSEDNFKHHVDNYLQAPEAERKNANKQILIPFFIVLAVIVILAIFVN